MSRRFGPKRVSDHARFVKKREAERKRVVPRSSRGDVASLEQEHAVGRERHMENARLGRNVARVTDRVSVVASRT